MQVRSIAVDVSGQWLASGSDDGSVRVWEVATARCMKTWDLGTPVRSVAWCPNPQLCILAAATASRVLLLSPGNLSCLNFLASAGLGCCSCSQTPPDTSMLKQGQDQSANI